VTLLIGFGVTLHEYRVARAERGRAEQRFTDMRQLARSNLFEFHDAIRDLPGSAPARNLVIQRALGYLDKLSHDELGDRGLNEELATGYERVADLQDNFSGPGIGDIGAAAASYGKALAIRESLAASSGNAVKDLNAEFDLLDGYVIVLQESGRIKEAEEVSRRGLDIAERLAAQQPGDVGAIRNQAQAHLDMGFVMGGNGSSSSLRELAEAIAHDRQAIELLRKLPASAQDQATMRAMIRSQWALGYHLRKNRQFEQSMEMYKELESGNKLQHFPLSVQSLFYNYRSRLLDDTGDIRGALRDERRALALMAPVKQADPHDLNAQINEAIDLGTIGMDEARLGNAVTGKEKVAQAIAEGERLYATNPQQMFLVSLLLIAHSFQGDILSSTGDQNTALEKYSAALQLATKLVERDPNDLDSRLNVAKIHVAEGLVLARAKRYREAREELHTGVTGLSQLLAMRPADAEILYSSQNAAKVVAALEGCQDHGGCEGIRRMPLPVMNN
jgi:eukaryotic-like serine/threonine-protein kinase